jgi:ABC-type glycerol-3-phosphate transport system substrate-binding protein
MKGTSSFQSIVLIVFIVLIAGGVGVFALYRGGGKSVAIGAGVTIWGTVDSNIMRGLLRGLGDTYEGIDKVVYVEQDPRTYIPDLINALASRTGPDLFLIAQDKVLENKDKILAIPFENYSERLFRDSFTEGGELFLAPNGILGFPLTVDPMVMYWNRDILTSEGYAVPPKYWDEFFGMSERISRADSKRVLSRSAVALGEYANVTHAKEIISLLALQAGTPIVEWNKSGSLTSVFKDKSPDSPEVPAEAAVRFYTEFSNPVQSTYSWNRSLPQSRQAFLGGDLAVYFGFASEFGELADANPNLNFDIAPMPQTRGGNGRAVTYGNMVGLVIPRASSNAGGALAVAQVLTTAQSLAMLGEYTGLPPVRRDMLIAPAPNTYSSTFYQMALISRGWLDPAPDKTGEVFRRMIDDVTAGRSRIRQAVSTASSAIQNLIAGD